MGYSQHGEDEFVVGFFERHPPCHPVFCDVGAFDGLLNSNTRALFERGWAGLAIEPHPFAFQVLARRYAGTGVLTLNVAIASREGELALHVPRGVAFGRLQLSTGRAAERERWPDVAAWDTLRVPAVRLERVLARLADPPDFISIDAEGMDHEVLRSAALDRAAHLPLLLMIEHNDNRHGLLDRCDADLAPLGYARVYHNHVNAAWGRPPA